MVVLGAVLGVLCPLVVAVLGLGGLLLGHSASLCSVLSCGGVVVWLLGGSQSTHTQPSSISLPLSLLFSSLLFVVVIELSPTTTTQTQPVRSLEEGYARATEKGVDVVVAEGDYRLSRTLVLSDGVSIFGGFSGGLCLSWFGWRAGRVICTDRSNR